MERKDKNHSILFIIIGIIIGMIFLSLKNSKKGVTTPEPPMEYPITVGDVSFTYVVERLGRVSSHELMGILHRISRTAAKEHKDNIRDYVDDELEKLMVENPTLKIFLDL
jgi:hypothetical protein